MSRPRSMSSREFSRVTSTPLFVNGRIKDVVLGEPCRDLVRLSLEDNQLGVFTEAYPYHTPSTPFNASFELLHSSTPFNRWAEVEKWFRECGKNCTVTQFSCCYLYVFMLECHQTTLAGSHCDFNFFFFRHVSIKPVYLKIQPQ